MIDTEEEEENEKEEHSMQGTYGVYEEDDLHTIIEDISNLSNQLASDEVNYRLIQRVNQYNTRNSFLKSVSIILFFVLIAALLGVKVIPDEMSSYLKGVNHIFDETFIWFVLIGCLAQIIDGSLGMAYGVTCNSFLLGMGIPPVTASASIHFAEIFTTGASGLSHLRFKNVNKKLFNSLLFPGIIGVILDSYILVSVVDGEFIKPIIAVYLGFLGVKIMLKALKPPQRKQKSKNIFLLAGVGGFLDAIGGGGWGPVVTSHMIQSGRSVVYTIGSVNLAEFFIALSGTGVFMILNGFGSWKPIVGLVIGGLIAAPFAAYVVSKVNPKRLMLMVGVLIVLLSVYNFSQVDFDTWLQWK